MSDETAIVTYEGKTLGQILEGYTQGQRRYLVMLAVGDDRLRAYRDSEITDNSVEVWRSKVPGFKEKERYLIADNTGKYIPEALVCFAKSIELKHLLFLDAMTSKGIDWVKGREIDREDKKYIMQCEMMINKLIPSRGISEGDGKGSYERMVLERRISGGT